MLFALNKDGKRIYIENTHVKEEYFCPECGEKLILKKGNIRMHHFSHPPSSNCCDSWHYDMSDWHINWQKRFPFNTQEIVKIKDGQKHRADVLIEDKKVVYEFQHSPLSPDEFDDRNNFYNSLGYKVIWIFDFSEQYENGLIDNCNGNIYSWSRPRKTLNTFNPKNYPNVELYFEIQGSAAENEYVQHIKSTIEAGYEIHLQNAKNYYDEHKDDEKILIRVTWTPNDGFERFASDGFAYSENDIINRFISSNEEKETTVRLGDLTDELKEMYSQSHTTYYFGCPRSSSHLCGDSNIDLPKNKYEEIFPCCECDYHTYDKNHKLKCKKRFIDLCLSGNTQVKILSNNDEGFITKISYSSDGKDIELELPVFSNPLKKSIFTLWEENKYKVAIFKNTRTNKYFKLNKNPTEQYYKYRKVFGWFSSNQYSFNGKSIELYGCDKPEWICVWNAK